MTQGDTAFSANPLFIHNPGECECRLSRDTSHRSPSGPTSCIQLQYLFIALHFRAGPRSAYFCPLIACKMWFLQAPDTLWAAGRLCSVVWGGRRLAKSEDAAIENHAFLFSQLSRAYSPFIPTACFDNMRLGWLVIKYLPTYRLYLRLVTCNRHHYNTLPEPLAGPPVLQDQVMRISRKSKSNVLLISKKERYTQQQNNECTAAFVWSWLSLQSVCSHVCLDRHTCALMYILYRDGHS